MYNTSSRGQSALLFFTRETREAGEGRRTLEVVGSSSKVRCNIILVHLYL